jgi:uncharacterized membrane protein
MSLVAPLFLLGALAVALPFWLHRLQTQSSDRKPFSSAMLLETTEQQIHVRKKLKFLALLALRAALLIIIALVFAKPLWTNPETLPGPGPDGTHLILVDTSASMDRQGIFEQATDLAGDAIESAPGGAMLQVLSASSDVREESGLSADRSKHLAAIQGLRPDAARLDFGDAMAVVDRLAETLPAPVTLHVISDFQDSGLPTRFADLVSSRVVSLKTHSPLAAAPGNWSIAAIRDSVDGVDVVIAGTGDDDMTATVSVTVNGVQAGRQEISGPGPATLGFAGLPLEPGDNRVQVSVDSRDDLVVDDSRYHVIHNEPPAPIPLLTLNSGGLPVTYLSAALHSDPKSSYRVEPMVLGEFDARTLARYRWIIVDDIGSLDPLLESALKEFVDNGGGVLAFAGRRSATATRLPLLDNAIRAASTSSVEDGFMSVGQIDTTHPLLAATEGWYAVNVSQAVPVIPQAEDQVLIRLENDEPLLLERRLGQGRVLLVSSDLENRWNDLPTRPVFVSFVIEAARYLSGSDQVIRSLPAGSTLPLSLIGGLSGQVIDPQGKTVLSLADTTRAQQIQLDQTGFYEVYTSQGDYVVAVNVDPRESQLDPMPAETLQRWIDAMNGSNDAAATQPFERQAEPVELWHTLLLILVMVLIAESLLGNWYLAPRTSGGSN